MARQLRGLGRSVRLVAALDGAPCNTGAGWKAWDPRYLFALAINLPRWIRDDTNQDWSIRSVISRIEGKLAYRFGIGVSPCASALPDRGTLDGETIRKLAANDGWRADQKAFLHAMYKAMIDYVPQPYHGPVVVYETKTPAADSPAPDRRRMDGDRAGHGNRPDHGQPHGHGRRSRNRRHRPAFPGQARFRRQVIPLSWLDDRHARSLAPPRSRRPFCDVP